MDIFDNLEIESPLMLAPIAGYADSVFRRISRRHGAGLTVTELVSSEGIIRRGEKTMALLRFHEEERPLAIQIFGSSPEVMAGAAKVVEDFGPDMIDINLGCPARKVCGTGSGAALLLEPETIYKIASGIVKEVSLPITAKIRIGWDDLTLTYRETVKALEEGGVSAIFVHGRTRAQKYDGLARWDVISEIASMTHLPVVGNGDIKTHEEAHARLRESGCRGVMIGRGAIGNPWIFSGMKPDIDDIISLVTEHLDLMVEDYGERGLVLMRKHALRYIHHMRNSSSIRRDITAAGSREEFVAILDRLKE